MTIVLTYGNSKGILSPESLYWIGWGYKSPPDQASLLRGITTFHEVPSGRKEAWKCSPYGQHGPWYPPANVFASLAIARLRPAPPLDPDLHTHRFREFPDVETVKK